MGWAPGPGPTNGNDVFTGTTGDDTADGLRGSDTLWGGDGADTLTDTQSGNDTLNGEGGDDFLRIERSVFSVVGASNVILDGGVGNDVVAVFAGLADRPVVATLIGGDGDDRLSVFGSHVTATLNGGAGNDEISLIDALTVTVTLGAGIDSIRIGTLSGGTGFGNFTVTDFTVGAGGDWVDVDDWLNEHLVNWDGANPFGSGGYARLVQDGADTLLQFDLDGGADSFVTAFRFQNTIVGAFTGDNFSGYSPTGTQTPGVNFVGTPGDDYFIFADGDDTADGQGGADFFSGGAGDDTLIGGAGNDWLDGGVGVDILYGGAGRDRLGANGDATMYGGDDDDEIAFTGDSPGIGHAIAYGEAGNDAFDTSGAAGTLSISAFGGAGLDTFSVWSQGNVALDGGADADIFTIEQINGAATLTLGDGADLIVLTAATSITQAVVITDFDAGPNGDRVDLIPYLDAVLTSWDHQTNPFGAGLARYVEAGGSTTLQLFYSGAWHDTLIFEGVSAAFLLQENLSDLPGDGSTPHVIEIFGEQGPDRLIGGFAPEIIYGGEERDYIEGGRGDDILYGGDDTDEIRGGDGNDIIIAGGGHAYFSNNDEVIGGAGSDTFVYQRGDGNLIIRDFQQGVDRIEVYGYSTGTITQGVSDASIDFGDPFASIYLPFFSGTLTLADFIFHAPPAIPSGPVITPPAGVTPGATIDPGADLTINAGQIYYANDIVFDHDSGPLITIRNSGSIVSITDGVPTGASGVGGPSFTPNAIVNVVNEQSGIIRARADDGTARCLAVEDVINHGIIEAVGLQAFGVDCNLGLVNSATGVIRTSGDINTFAASAGLTFDNAGLIEAICIHRAVAVTGAVDSWINSGIIRAYSEELSIGVWTAGGLNFINSGTIEADFAFYTPSTSGGPATIENSGHILGDILLLDASNHIGNTNEIVGDIFLNAGQDSVANSGDITGDIYLGYDDDSYTGADGHLHGAIYAGYGDDTIMLGDDGNHVFGEEGADHIVGGAGDDVIDGGRGDDILEGGGGTDTLSFASSSMGVTVDLSQGTVVSPTGVDAISGFESLRGSRHDDVLSGSAGDNAISGSAGDDIINGAGGADVLAGGAGDDTLAGGVGADRYMFVRGDGDDVITDFDPAQDHIEVWGYATYESLQQAGAHVLVFLSPYNSILLQNTTVAALSASNFTFHADMPPVGNEPAPAAEPGAETIYLFDEDYHVNAGEEIHFSGLGSAFHWVYDGSLGPVSTVTNDGSVRVTAHSTVVGVNANFINNVGAELIVELVGESEGDPRIAFGISSSIEFYTAINYGLIEVHSSADAEGVSELTLFENHGVFRVTAEGQARGIWAFDSATGFVNTGIFEIYGDGGGTTGYQVQVSGGVFNNSGIFRVGSAVSNSVAIDFGYNGQTQVFTNSGLIEAVYAIIGDGDGVTWGVADVQNTGEIYGIITLGRGDDRIVNHNLMSGPISLGAGVDQYLGADGHQIGGVYGNDGNDILIAGVNSGDILDGGAGRDTLDGGAGADQMAGGLDNDIMYVDDMGDVVIENVNEGIDTVRSSIGYVLTANVENLELTGAGDISGTGNGLNNALTGNAGANTLNGGDGADTLDGGLGVDVLNGGGGDDTFIYTIGDGNGVMNGGEGTDTLAVTDGAAGAILNATWSGATLTVLSGNALTNIEAVTADLSGGADWLVYAAASAAVTVNLATGAASGFTSIANIERVVGGNGDDTLTGNGLDNRLDGGGGNDVLAGGGGVDTLIGGDGADALSGGLSNDSIQGGAGNDSINWAVGDGRDTIDGGADFDTFNAMGAASAQLGNATWNGTSLTALMDNGLANLEAINLDLGGGVDWLIYSASAAVVVNLATNSASGFASVSNIEKLIGGSGNDMLTGDGFDNRLDGQGGADTLDGGAGSDAVLGGDGDDVIYASAGNDSLQGQNGNDTFHWTSTDGRDTFNGGADSDTVNLTGSAAPDVADASWNGSAITGLLNNALIDIEAINLDLGAGGAGGDWLRYNTAFGVTVNLATGAASGFASIVGVENLIGGTGNDNLTGDGGVNKINGANGDDVITGGAGNDNLTGGAGADAFVYGAGCGNDTINDFDAWAFGGQDFLDVSAFGINAGNFATRVAIIDTGSDTVVRIDDTYFITLKNVTGDGDNAITQADFIFGP